MSRWSSARPAALLIFALLLLSIPIDSVLCQVCFKGEPLPDCRAFMVTELGLAVDVKDPTRPDNGYVASDLGLMVNLNEDYAVGGSYYISYASRYSQWRTGVRLRVRRWLTDHSSINISGGPLLTAEWNEDPIFTGHIDYNYKELLVPFVGVDYVQGKSRGNDLSYWQAGARFGSLPGTIMTAAAAGMVLAAFMIYAAAG
jgi:hypothetical protein